MAAPRGNQNAKKKGTAFTITLRVPKDQVDTYRDKLARIPTDERAKILLGNWEDPAEEEDEEEEPVRLERLTEREHRILYEGNWEEVAEQS